MGGVGVHKSYELFLIEGDIINQGEKTKYLCVTLESWVWTGPV